VKFIFRNIAKLGYKIGDYCTRKLEGEREKTVRRWFNDKGDETLRLNYPGLTPDSFVMDLGGYKGGWASDIYAKYNCTVWIFEPVKEFADAIRDRFSKNKKISVFEFGLGKADDKRIIYVDNDGTSFFRTSDKPIEATQKDISEFFREHTIRSVELMKITIEGGEYDVLDRLIETGLIREIKNVQVQFHDFVPNAEVRMRQIQEKLKSTHTLTYQYKFVWENWERQ